MKIDNYLDSIIEAKFIDRNKIEMENHKSSGKLSAGSLNDPLQWQILKALGVPSKEFDEYTLRKFFRGRQIEDWAISEISDIVEEQKLVEYKNCIGFADALVNTKNWDNKLGIIPIEIKSVANAKFKRIINGGGADKGHILQAAYYALGLGIKHFAIIYIASDDLRIRVFIEETKKYKEEIDLIIDNFHKTLKDKIIPVFVERESWQKNLLYNKFPSWVTLTQEEIKVAYDLFKQK